MHARIRIQCRPNVWLEVDSDTPQEAIKIISKYIPFVSEEKCGKCGKNRIFPDHRLSKGFHYYTLKCQDCGSQLDIHEHKEERGGGIYITRNNESGNYDTENRGWYHWKDRKRDSELDQGQGGQRQGGDSHHSGGDAYKSGGDAYKSGGDAYKSGGDAYSEPIGKGQPDANARLQEDGSDIPF